VLARAGSDHIFYSRPAPPSEERLHLIASLFRRAAAYACRPAQQPIALQLMRETRSSRCAQPRCGYDEVGDDQPQSLVFLLKQSVP